LSKQRSAVSLSKKTTSEEPAASGGFAHHASNIMHRGLVLT